MLSAQEAEKIILSQQIVLKTKHIKLQDAIGKYLAQEIIADRDFPPFDRVAMDGIAIRYSDFAAGKRAFPLGGLQLAGAKPIEVGKDVACIEIMTGASMPAEFDTIIRYEDIEINEKRASVLKDAVVKAKQNIHFKGMDTQKNRVLASPHQCITPSIVGVAATVGIATIEVFELPNIAIISTGDELVDVDKIPEDHQIRRSNALNLKTALIQHKIVSSDYHIPDKKDILEVKILELLKKNDILILSGGVSKGKADFVPEVLTSLGVKKQFHKIKQKPGKPLWFGKTDHGKLVFGLPGNPVSSYLCLQKYIIPLLVHHLSGREHQWQKVQLEENLTVNSSLTFFMQVSIRNSEGRLLAKPILGNGSGDLFHLSLANGFIEIPPESNQILAGTALNFIPC